MLTSSNATEVTPLGFDSKFPRKFVTTYHKQESTMGNIKQFRVLFSSCEMKCFYCFHFQTYHVFIVTDIEHYSSNVTCVLA